MTLTFFHARVEFHLARGVAIRSYFLVLGAIRRIILRWRVYRALCMENSVVPRRRPKAMAVALSWVALRSVQLLVVNPSFGPR